MRFALTLILLGISIFSRAESIFYYAPEDGKGGIRYAYQTPGGEWSEIGSNYNFLSSDFGSWGTGKKMWNPQIYKTGEEWAVVFSVTPNSTVYGITTTSDLIHWKPQKYIKAEELDLEINKFKDISTKAVVRIDGENTEGYEIPVSQGMIKQLFT